jgi:hypothetical protein
LLPRSWHGTLPPPSHTFPATTIHKHRSVTDWLAASGIQMHTGRTDRQYDGQPRQSPGGECTKNRRRDAAPTRPCAGTTNTGPGVSRASESRGEVSTGKRKPRVSILESRGVLSTCCAALFTSFWKRPLHNARMRKERARRAPARNQPATVSLSSTLHCAAAPLTGIRPTGGLCAPHRTVWRF